MNTNILTSILAQQSGGFSNLLGSPIVMMIAMFAILYLVMIRPQQKRQKELRDQINALKINDKVVTIGGLHGMVMGIGEKTITLKVEDGTRIEFDKQAVARVVK